MPHARGRGAARWWWLLGLVVVVGVWLVVALVEATYTAYRFDRYAETADAVILGSDVGCLSAIGGSGSSGVGGRSSISYDIEFPYRGGTHRTRVVRPCGVIPPDFGRGRGRIWIQYDREQPDRTRVVNDDTDAHDRFWLTIGLNVYLVVTVVGGLVIRRRYPPEDPQPAARRDRGPH